MVGGARFEFLLREGQIRELSVSGTVLFLWCYVSGCWNGVQFVWEFVDDILAIENAHCLAEEKNATVAGRGSRYWVVVGSKR